MENHLKNGSLPPEIVAEYRILKNNLFRSFDAASRQQTIMVLSSVHGEGSSTVAKNISRVIAEDPGSKVLLIDMNVRSGVRHAGQELPPGLSNYLSDEGVPPAALLLPGDAPNFFSLPPGNADCDASLILRSGMFDALLAEYKRTFTSIIIDAPPLQYSPESNQLASQVDGIILVVRAEATKREIVARTSKRLSAMRANVLGIVLNRKQYYIPHRLYSRL